MLCVSVILPVPMRLLPPSLVPSTPFNRTPPRSLFAGKIGTRIFLFRAHPGSKRHVSWRRNEGLLALLRHESAADSIHHFLETTWVTVADGGTLADVHVHGAAHF